MRVSLVLARTARLVVAALAIALLGVLWAPGASAADAAKKSLTPFVDCYFLNADGTVTVSIGVTSTNATTVTVPVGGENKVTNVAAAVKDDLGQPTVFLPGTRRNVWAPTVTMRDIDKGADWELTGNKVQLAASVTSCSEKPVPAEGNALAVLAFAAVVTVAGALALSGRPGRRTGRAPA